MYERLEIEACVSQGYMLSPTTAQAAKIWGFAELKVVATLPVRVCPLIYPLWIEIEGL